MKRQFTLHEKSWTDRIENETTICTFHYCPTRSQTDTQRYAYPFGNGWDEIRYRTHFFIYFLSCKRTERPGKVLRASYAILQRHTTGRTLVKNLIKKRVNRSVPVPNDWYLWRTQHLSKSVPTDLCANRNLLHRTEPFLFDLFPPFTSINR